MHIFLCYFFSILRSSHNTWFENFETVLKRMFCEHVHAKRWQTNLLYIKKTISAELTVNRAVFLNSQKQSRTQKISMGVFHSVA